MNRQFRKCTLLTRWIICITAFILTLMPCFVYADDVYTATTMRLLRYEGDVEITDETGSSRFIMENVRFNSGESMTTGESSMASVGLDTDRILTLNENTHVEFAKQNSSMEISLKEGSLLLDVQDKLGSNETLDIRTSTMVVGIRGTIVFVSADTDLERNSAENDTLSLTGGNAAALGVLEGTASITYKDESGASRMMPVHAGEIAVVPKDNTASEAGVKPVISTFEADDIPEFVKEQIAQDASMAQRISAAAGDPAGKEDQKQDPDTYSADGSWSFDGTVSVVAQSASKMYDGTPLTRSGDVLVYGLPQNFSITASAGGSETDAGTGSNPIVSYVIYNSSGEDVTSHFPNVETVPGTLTVDPAPAVVWTGSAAKVYDGTPLTNEEAQLRASLGYKSGDPVWRNTSYTLSESNAQSTDSETLYGICGSVLVHGTNPLTGEIREISLFAGQKLMVCLDNEGGKESISYEIQHIEPQELPEEILLLYADNPDLMRQACNDAGWDIAVVEKLIKPFLEKADNENKEIPEKNENNDLLAADDISEKLMIDAANVRITIDTDITSYNGRVLGSEEAHFTPVNINERVKIKATGSQTDVGRSVNTYEISWGSENPENFIIEEDLGTLEVTAANALVTTGSAQKVYDGTPLLSEEASLTGLVNGETAYVAASGAQTEPGQSVNTYTITWGSAKPGNYSLSESLGTLLVTPKKAVNTEITFTAGSAEKVYDGDPLTAAGVTAAGLPEGYTFEAAAAGSRTDAGSAANVVVSYKISDKDGKDVTAEFTNIRTVDGTLTVTPAPLTVKTGSASKKYDGTALDGADATITDLPEGTSTHLEGLLDMDARKVTAKATGSITKVGTAENTYAIDWGSVNPANYELTEELGTLEVTANDTKITLTAATASKVYDGVPLTAASVSAEGLPSGFTCIASAEGSRKDAGSSANTVASYKILNAEEEDVTDAFTNITTTDGTLTVTKAQASVRTGSASKKYDGTALKGADASITDLPGISAQIAGLAGTDAGEVTVTADAQITDIGTTKNTYTIDWGSANSENYALSEELGTLEVTVNDAAITITAPSHTWVYDGIELAVMGGASVSGLPEGLDIVMTATGSRKDVGTSVTGVSYYIMDPVLEKEVTDYFTNITVVNGALTVTPAPVTVKTGSASRKYDGTALTQAEVSITGLVDSEADKVTVEATGTITDVGNTENTYTIDWGSVNSENYALTEELGTLEVTVNDAEITITAASASKVYDGAELVDENVTVTGLPDGFFCVAWAEGSQTDAGSSANTVGSYQILTEEEDDATDAFTNISTVDGTLTVTKAPVTITTGSLTAMYEGPETSLDGSLADAAITGLADPDKYEVTVMAVGSLTGIGSVENGYTINWGTADSVNYTITEELGTLTIIRQKLAVDLGGGTRTYDAEVPNPLPIITYGNGDYAGQQPSVISVTGFDGEGGTLKYELYNGDRITLNVYPLSPGAGTYVIENDLSFDSGDVSNYEIEYSNDTVTINPLQLNIDLGGKTVNYTGSSPDVVPAVTYGNGSHAGETVQATAATIFAGEGGIASFKTFTEDAFTLQVAGVPAEPGTYEIGRELIFNVGDAANYSIVYSNETVTIKPAGAVGTLGAKSRLQSLKAPGESLSETKDNAAEKGSDSGTEPADTAEEKPETEADTPAGDAEEETERTEETPSGEKEEITEGTENAASAGSSEETESERTGEPQEGQTSGETEESQPEEVAQAGESGQAAQSQTDQTAQVQQPQPSKQAAEPQTGQTSDRRAQVQQPQPSKQAAQPQTGQTSDQTVQTQQPQTFGQPAEPQTENVSLDAAEPAGPEAE